MDLQRRMSRRGFLRGAAAGLVALNAGPLSLLRSAVAAPAGFAPVPGSKEDRLILPQGYAHTVLLRWGDPLAAGVPAFNPMAQTAAKQAQQFGYNPGAPCSPEKRTSSTTSTVGAGPLRARGGGHHPLPRRVRRSVPGGRRTLRIHLQVCLQPALRPGRPAGQPAATGPRHTVRRPVPGRRHRRVAVARLRRGAAHRSQRLPDAPVPQRRAGRRGHGTRVHARQSDALRGHPASGADRWSGLRTAGDPLAGRPRGHAAPSQRGGGHSGGWREDR